MAGGRAAAPAPPNFYDVLGVETEATPKEIKQAYRRAALHSHPDKAQPKDKPVAERRFKEVSEAYTVLSDERLRQTYDLYLSCLPYGVVEVAHPDDPREYDQVPFSDWQEFQRLMDCVASSAASGSSGRARGRARGNGGASGAGEEDAASEAPLSVLEWVVGGGLLCALWSLSVWYHRRRVWLEELPYEIWRLHCQQSAPLAMLLSPFFFGTVPFRDGWQWFKSAVKYLD